VFAKLAALADDAYDQVRQSIFGLRARPAGGGGWLPSLTAYLEEFRARTGIEATLTAAGGLPARLRAPTEVQLVRIVQEALTNVQKHAGTERVRIHLRRDEGALLATIEDDGRGFDPVATAAERRGHFGLATMRERAESVGGRLEVDAAPGRGTRVVATLPDEA
jgi:signal transduction histidine kinase